MDNIKTESKVTGYIDNPNLSEEERSREIYRVYEGEQEEWKLQADENEAFASGVQWTKKQIAILKKRGQAPVAINAITWAIEQMKALMTANKPKFQAVAREDSDLKKANVIAMLLEYIWDISDGNAVLKAALDDYAKLGRGCLYAFPDPYASSGTGEVKFISVDPRDVFPDPATKDYLWRDAAHILVVTHKTDEQIKTMYPEFDLAGAVPYDDQRTNDSERFAMEGQQFAGESSQHFNQVYKIVDRMTKKIKTVYHVIDPFSGQEYEFNEDALDEYKNQTVYSVGGQIVTATDEVDGIDMLIQSGDVEEVDDGVYLHSPPVNPQTGQQPEPVIITEVPMSRLIKEEAIAIRKIKQPRIWRIVTIGDKLFWEGYLPTEHYPVIPINNLWGRNPYCISDVNMVRPVQELINKLNSLIIANAASATNQKVLLPRGSQDKSRIEADLNKAGSTVIEFDAEIGAPVIFGATPFPNALFSQIEMYISMIERQFGIYALMDGNAAQAPQTFKGTMAMDEFGQRRIKSKKDDVETSLNQLGRVCLDYARAVYTHEKVVRVVAVNGEVDEAELNTVQYDDLNQAIGRFNDINTGRYDVRVISGSTLPSNRYALMEYYMDLYERGIIDQVEVLKKAEVIDIEGVLDRFGYIQQLEQKLAQMEEELKKVQGDLQTASREEVHAKKRLEVEKFKSELEGIKTNAAASARIFEDQQRNQMARNVEDSNGVA